MTDTSATQFAQPVMEETSDGKRLRIFPLQEGFEEQNGYEIRPAYRHDEPNYWDPDETWYPECSHEGWIAMQVENDDEPLYTIYVEEEYADQISEGRISVELIAYSHYYDTSRAMAVKLKCNGRWYLNMNEDRREFEQQL